ncbi:MAG: Wzz/FepE/Etk N-terminal domain-containing protein [Candidatus Tenebribacter davisii]|nr:Wzz/FepE/Etk N-terminal domain-containing protein [Candidatus Tenebribacter davisii]
MENRQIDLLDLTYFILKHKIFIIFTTIIVSIAAVVYSLLVPFSWTSTTTCLSVNNENSGFSLGSSSLLGLGSSILGGGVSENQNLITIMQSREFSEDIIKKFNLIEHLKIQESDSILAMELAVKSLVKNITDIGINEETGVITINVTTGEKELSATIANHYLEKLEDYSIRKRKTKGKQKRIFLEKRLKEEKSKIESLATKIMQFSKDHNTISIEEQTTAMISHYSNLVAQKITAEIELELTEKNFGSDSPNARVFKDQIGVLQNKLRIRKSDNIGNPKYILNLDSIPELAMENKKLLLQFEIESKVYKYLYPEYEAAKIEEVKDLPTLEIIDHAIPVGKRTSPKRGRICVFSFLLALILSSGSMIVLEILKQINSENKNLQKIDRIKQTLKK